MGLALENFDAVGKWRTHDDGALIDPTGVTTDGSKLEGVKSLRELTKRYSDQFAVVVTEKLLTYAVGRGMEDRDMPMVRTITRASKAKNYRFSSLVLGVVESKAFQMNMKSSEVSTHTERAGR
jgi:hypothetical protein